MMRKLRGEDELNVFETLRQGAVKKRSMTNRTRTTRCIHCKQKTVTGNAHSPSTERLHKRTETHHANNHDRISENGVSATRAPARAWCFSSHSKSNGARAPVPRGKDDKSSASTAATHLIHNLDTAHSMTGPRGCEYEQGRRTEASLLKSGRKTDDEEIVR